jgi:hypothetical protein
MSAPPFSNGDLVEIETANLRAVARVRESSKAGRLHLALEGGEYLPWVDGEVLIRRFGEDPARSCVATILHAGASTALLQLVEKHGEPVEPPHEGGGASSAPPAPPALPAPEPNVTIPSIDDDW